MSHFLKIFTYVFLCLNVVSYSNVFAQLIDKKATKETRNLYKNLIKLSDKGIMFGHQDDLAYGVNWKYEKGRSDIFDVVEDYPAVFGWDIGGIEHQRTENIDHVPFDKMIEYIKEVYRKGGVNTISWHVDNPKTLGNSWDTENTVADILPKGKLHERYKTWLDNAAIFLKQLKSDDGKYIPILFRPFHELKGGWFWWGKPHCTEQEYINLWKFTVDYLKYKHKINHLIYVFNTNDFKNEEEFLERYPGNNYADMLSFDTYQYLPGNVSEKEIEENSIQFITQLKNNLAVLESVGKKNNKPVALAETGFEAIPYNNWWTNIFYEAIKDFKISYVLLWRNHGLNSEGKMHYYVPYPTQQSAQNFKEFYNKQQIYFLKKVSIENLYK